MLCQHERNKQTAKQRPTIEQQNRKKNRFCPNLNVALTLAKWKKIHIAKISPVLARFPTKGGGAQDPVVTFPISICQLWFET